MQKNDIFSLTLKNGIVLLIIAAVVAPTFYGLVTAMLQGVNNALTTGTGTAAEPAQPGGEFQAAPQNTGGDEKLDTSGVGGRMPALATSITGVVYKNVDGDPAYNPDNDIPIQWATVTAAVSGNVVATARTDESGKYTLSVSTGTTYKLAVTLPLGGSYPTWSPTTQQWKTGHSTVKATDTVQNTDVTIGQSPAPVTHDIAVDYLPLNYGPTDFSYELWHYGPIFSSKQNVVLVHGINVWTPGVSLVGSGYVRGSPDNSFGGTLNQYSGLAKVLQDKSNIRPGDFYNAWDFEYAETQHTTLDGVRYFPERSNEVYGKELAQVLLGLGSIPVGLPGGGFIIIGHSMGGLVARCAVQLSGASNYVTNIITLDSPGIFGGGFAGIKNPPGWLGLASDPVKTLVKEMDQNSELLWRLNSDYTKQKYPFKVLTLVADPALPVNPLIGYVLGIDPSEGNAGSRLVECGPDGSIIPNSQSAWAIVPNKDHVGTCAINDASHPSFQLIKQFLNGGVFTGSPTGKPCFTFVFKHKVELTGYPQVILPGGTKIVVSDMIANTYNIGGATCYAYTLQAPASEHGTMKIYWDAYHYATATLTQSQSAIRKEVINN